MTVEMKQIAKDEADIRLDRWFKRHYPDLSHIAVQKLLRGGQIRVDGKRATANQRLLEGQIVRVPPLESYRRAAPEGLIAPREIDPVEAEALRQCVLYKDDSVIVLNKPPGLAVQGGTGMSDRHLDAMLDALRFDAKDRPRIAHRLDKDTSGVLILGRTAAATAKLAEAFRLRQVRKCYWALVMGVPKLPAGRISAALAKMPGRMGDKVAIDEDEGKHAVTYYRVVDRVQRKVAWLEMEPRTGRTHQLRAHCVVLGTPILGDGKYGGAEAFLSAQGQGLSRKLHLHARALRLPHPKGGLIEVTAPLPVHIQASFELFGFSEGQAGKPFQREI